MKKILFSLILALTATTAFAMFEDWQVGIRPNAMAGAYTAIANDVEGVRWNPSGLAELKGWQTVAYAKRLWNIPGLVNQTLTAGREFGNWGGVAVSVQQVGCDWESDQRSAVARFQTERPAGVRLQYQRLPAVARAVRFGDHRRCRHRPDGPGLPQMADRRLRPQPQPSQPGQAP